MPLLLEIGREVKQEKFMFPKVSELGRELLEPPFSKMIEERNGE